MARWEAQNKAMFENILGMIQRDPGCRVLVAAECRRLHRLVSLLHLHADVFEIINYQTL